MLKFHILPLTNCNLGISPIIFNLDNSCLNGPLMFCNNSSNRLSFSNVLAIQYTLTDR